MTALAPAAGAEARAPSGAAPRHRPRLVFGVLAVLVLCFAVFAVSRMFPAEPYGMADDWRVFFAAGSVVHHGGSPYDPALIHAAEQQAEYYASVQPSLDDFVNLPIVAWLLQPFAALPFWASYALAAALGVVASAVALVTWLRRLGWRSPLRWTGLALVSWPALLGVFSGQFDLLLLALLIAAVIAATDGHDVLAGALCAAAAVVKPHVLWPLPLLLVACQLPDRRAAARTAGAAAAVALLAVAGGEVLIPGATAQFLNHLVAFGSRVGTVQPDLAGLPGLLGRLPGGDVLAGLVVVAGGVATLGFAAFWAIDHRARALPRTTRVALGVCAGLALWLAATPYAHPNDDVLLFPLVALLVGADASRLRARDLLQALLAIAAVVAGFLVAPAAGAAVTVIAAAVVWSRRGAARQSALAAVTLTSLALLPMVWPFHALGYSLTPLAVFAAALAGVELVRRTLGAVPSQALGTAFAVSQAPALERSNTSR